MRTSESISDLATALAAAQSELEDAGKDKSGYGYSYADLAQVLQLGRPVLSKHGLSVVQIPHNEDGGIALTTRLMHKSGEWLEDTLIMPAEKGKGRSTAQDIGTIITYSRRYMYTAMVGITQEDQDGTNKSAGGKPTEMETVRMPRPVSVAKAALDGIAVDWVQADQYVSGLKASVNNEDEAGVRELMEELAVDSDMKIAVWTKMDSKERSYIKALSKGAA